MSKEKTGGRQSGTQNKTTKEIKEMFILLVNNNLETLQKDIESLKPIDRVKTIIELSKLILPINRIEETEGKNFIPIRLEFDIASNNWILDENETTN